MHPTYPTKCAYVEPKVDECMPLITGLHPKSTYDLYVVAIDDDVAPYGGNLQGLATQLTFKAASTDAHMGGLLARTVDGAGLATHLRVQPGFKQSLFFYQAGAYTRPLFAQLQRILWDRGAFRGCLGGV
jgi:hypothetical protein